MTLKRCTALAGLRLLGAFKIHSAEELQACWQTCLATSESSCLPFSPEGSSHAVPPANETYEKGQEACSSKQTFEMPQHHSSCSKPEIHEVRNA
jgi:hypothetical protein